VQQGRAKYILEEEEAVQLPYSPVVVGSRDNNKDSEDKHHRVRTVDELRENLAPHVHSILFASY